MCISILISEVGVILQNNERPIIDPHIFIMLRLYKVQLKVNQAILHRMAQNQPVRFDENVSFPMPTNENV